MFQWKIDEIFNDMPNVFGTADDILVVLYGDDGRDQNSAEGATKMQSGQP